MRNKAKPTDEREDQRAEVLQTTKQQELFSRRGSERDCVFFLKCLDHAKDIWKNFKRAHFYKAV